MKLLLVSLLLLGASAAYGEIYTWSDARGTDFYTNSVEEIPARYLKKARIWDVATGKKGRLVTAAAPAPQGQGVSPAVPAPVLPSSMPTAPVPVPVSAAPAPTPVPMQMPTGLLPGSAVANPQAAGSEQTRPPSAATHNRRRLPHPPRTQREE